MSTCWTKSTLNSLTVASLFSETYCSIGLSRKHDGTACVDATCDGVLIWDDGSDFVFDDIKASCASINIGATHAYIRLHVEDGIIGGTNANLNVICTVPCDE